MDAARQQQGPHAADQMAALVRNGTVGSATLVWSPGMAGWVAIAQSALAAQIPPGTAPGMAPPGGDADSFAGAVRTCFSKYATFQGRARRPEFWFFLLFDVLASVVAWVVNEMLFGLGSGISPVHWLYSLATLTMLVPALAVGARRLHDIDRSGWWQLILVVPLLIVIVLIVLIVLIPTVTGWLPLINVVVSFLSVILLIVLIVFWCQCGTAGRNRFG